MKPVYIIGGGLAGTEAALQLADRGLDVHLVEMRPGESSAAHRTGDLAEIVCANSFKSTLTQTASGLLKAELDILGCRLLEFARRASVPAGHALAVDREVFSRSVTAAVERHPRISVERRRQDDLNMPRPAILATGPLTSARLSKALEEHCEETHLFFYDAIAPSVDASTVDSTVAYRASRYGKGEPDYLNIPLSRAEYVALMAKLREADTVEPHGFEDEKYFESCLPIEVMARRGEDTARFGPLRPKGLPDPRTGREPYAVIQLRQETMSGDLLGLVGFQTRMSYGSQKAIVRSIPGLHEAKILRYGSIHRNTYLDLPVVCEPYLRDRTDPGLFYAGQICGVEGYVECIAAGLVAALSVFADECGRVVPGSPGTALPRQTMVGALMGYVHTRSPDGPIQPMNANMGILPRLQGPKMGRRERYQRTADRALSAMSSYRLTNAWLFETA